jgi:leucyl aminopeptidase
MKYYSKIQTFIRKAKNLEKNTLNIHFDISKERQKSSILLVDYFENCTPEFGNRFPKDDPFYELVLPAFETGDFKGLWKQTTMIYTYGKMPETRILLLGLGKQEEITPFKIKVAFAHALKKIQIHDITEVTTYIDKKCCPNDFRSISEFLAEAAYLSQYKLPSFKKESSDKKQSIEKIHLLLPDSATEQDKQEFENGVTFGKCTGAVVNEVRTMINLPSNYMTPTILADHAKQLSQEFSTIETEIFDRTQIETMGMGGLLNVGKGSNEPMCFIKSTYTPKNPTNPHTVALVGKGITFDSGGISLKPSRDMHQMKDDMGGAAIVLGILKLAAQLDLPMKLMALVPTCENIPSSNSYKPGDIITCFDGTTVEVYDTDAEGRLILMDALAYAVHEKADVIIDLATLTSACSIALGRYVIGGLSNHQPIMDIMQNSGSDIYDRIWQFPFLKEYKDSLKSDFADLKNYGGRDGGTITAGVFLSHFVGKTPWIHLDIAAVTWFESETALMPKGASGIGVRLLMTFLQNLAKNQDPNIWETKGLSFNSDE